MILSLKPPSNCQHPQTEMRARLYLNPDNNNMLPVLRPLAGQAFICPYCPTKKYKRRVDVI